MLEPYKGYQIKHNGIQYHTTILGIGILYGYTIAELIDKIDYHLEIDNESESEGLCDESLT